MTLRAKLLLASAFLLVLPYLGYRYVNEMERHLRRGLETNLLGTATALASALHDRPVVADLIGSPDPASEVFVHTLPGPMEVDGYAADWEALGIEMTDLLVAPATAQGFSARYAAGRHDGYLYLLVEVRDPRLVYATEDDLGRGASDHLRLTLAGSGSPQTYVVDTVSPGWARTTEVLPQASGVQPQRRAYRISGEWRERGAGYVVELRLPVDLVGDGLRIEVDDVRDPRTRAVVARASSGHPLAAGAASRVGRLIRMSPEIGSILRGVGTIAGRRVWVVDQSAWVRARVGSLEAPAEPAELSPLFRWLLTPPSLDEDQPSSVSRLNDPVVRDALAGRATARWRRSHDADVPIVSAAHPIRLGKRVVGAVLVEENASPIQTVRRQALADLFLQTLLVACVAALVLVWFASRLVGRLQRLRDEANLAIDRHGRVIGAIHASEADDEIGDLGRSISAMLERLRRYNDYLEQLASRLSHELRTPIAVIRSSLENLERTVPGQSDVYASRAMEGLGRLSAILQRMSEATRIEQSLQGTEPEVFDLVRVLTLTTDAYGQTWRERPIHFSYQPAGGGDPALAVRGVPDLVVQALDKLVANADEFSPPGAPIEVRLSGHGDEAWLEVENLGPPLPVGLGERIFDSLVSDRDPDLADSAPAERADGPHLGLGLYIVRLIAEFHRGTVRAFSREDGRGVVFRLTFPLVATRSS